MLTTIMGRPKSLGGSPWVLWPPSGRAPYLLLTPVPSQSPPLLGTGPLGGLCLLEGVPVRRSPSGGEPEPPARLGLDEGESIIWPGWRQEGWGPVMFGGKPDIVRL